MLLAWHMSERTGECFPSQALLAKEAHISLRAVQYALSQLEQKNLITRRAEKDDRGVIVRTLYAMSIPNRGSQGVQDVSHTVHGGVAQGAGGCRTDCTGVSHTVHEGVAQGACKQGIEQGIKQGTEQGIEALPPSPPPARRKTAFPCPPEINPEAWDAWMQVRKAKRTGGITEYGWKLFCNQAAKAGLTPAQAIDLCIERGWQGFKAEWLKREQEPEDDFKRMGRQERERQRLAKQQGQAPAPSSKPASEQQNHDDEIYEELNGLF